MDYIDRSGRVATLCRVAELIYGVYCVCVLCGGRAGGPVAGEGQAAVCYSCRATYGGYYHLPGTATLQEKKQHCRLQSQLEH